MQGIKCAKNELYYNDVLHAFLTQVVSRSIGGVGFGFYSSQEARKLSVKEITEPVLFDNLRNPVPGGLYDPSLGPLGFNET